MKKNIIFFNIMYIGISIATFLILVYLSFASKVITSNYVALTLIALVLAKDFFTKIDINVSMWFMIIVLIILLCAVCIFVYTIVVYYNDTYEASVKYFEIAMYFYTLASGFYFIYLGKKK